MTTIFKYAPRMAQLPASFHDKAASAGFAPAFFDEMLDAYAEALGRPSDEQGLRYEHVLRWYFAELEAYEREHDPAGAAAAERNARVMRDFDALCPSIPNVTAATLDKEMEGSGIKLIFFYSSPGCKWCIPLAQSLEALAPEQTDVQMMKVNKNTDPDLCDRFWVKNGLPLMIVFINQSIRAVHMGYLPVEQAREFIDGAAADRRKYHPRPEPMKPGAEPVCVDGVCEVPARV